jgi:hypothetical protein
MADIYGSQWISSHGETPTPMWAEMIGELTDEQVRRGIEGCKRNDSPFPPSLGQFRSWTKGSQQPPVVLPQLPKPRNLELARAHLKPLLKRLKGGE